MKKVIYFLILLTLIFIAGCTTNEKIENTGTLPVWMTTPLTDVNSNDNFKISDFLGKPMLIESFAVWCPTCTRQQNEIRDLHDIDNSFISISLDTDPNEGEDQLKEHTDRNNFEWRYSIAPVELTRSLIDEFENQVINAPSAPVILVVKMDQENY